MANNVNDVNNLGHNNNPDAQSALVVVYQSLIGTEVIEGDIFDALNAVAGCTSEKFHAIIDSVRRHFRSFIERGIEGGPEDMILETYTFLKNLSVLQLTSLVTGKFAQLFILCSVSQFFSVPVADLVKLGVTTLETGQREIKQSVDGLTSVIAELNLSVQGLRSDMAGLKKDIKELQEDVGGLNDNFFGRTAIDQPDLSADNRSVAPPDGQTVTSFMVTSMNTVLSQLGIHDIPPPILQGTKARRASRAAREASQPEKSLARPPRNKNV